MTNLSPLKKALSYTSSSCKKWRPWPRKRTLMRFWNIRMLPFKTRSLIIDRKSTRLNSNHATISYAVFCLKKKKKINKKDKESNTHNLRQYETPYTQRG